MGTAGPSPTCLLGENPPLRVSRLARLPGSAGHRLSGHQAMPGPRPGAGCPSAALTWAPPGTSRPSHHPPRHPGGLLHLSHPDRASPLDLQPLRDLTPGGEGESEGKPSPPPVQLRRPDRCPSPGEPGKHRREFPSNSQPSAHTRLHPLSKSGNRVQFPEEPHICLRYCPMK